MTETTTTADWKEGAKAIGRAMVDSGLSELPKQEIREPTENAQVVLKRRYLSKDREGNILEDTDGMFRRVAKNLSEADLIYLDDKKARKVTEDKFYRAMRSLDILPNSPTLMNAGRELQQLSACFVLPVEDSLDGIFDKVKQTALIHKSGGGTGFAFSRLRPEGDLVGSTGGVASGPVSFIRAFDTGTDVVKQGGTRRGANMGILDVTHPDILKFIHAKEDGVNLQNFNISVAATDEFMDRVMDGGKYNLVNPRTGKVTKEMDAKEVFGEIVQMAWKTGDPGLVFIDAINRGNPNPQLGRIESTNPCGEQPLTAYESCNLASINLANMIGFEKGTAELDYERIRKTVKVGVHLLDNVIDMNRYPIPEIDEMTKKTRRIGLGVMGLADMLVQMGIRYDSEEALELVAEVMGFIQEETHIACGDLAEVRGNFPAWEGSVYGSGSGGEPRKGMRNSAPTTIAPTGTISIIAGASSGIEPLFALAYVRNVMDNTKLIESNPYFEAVARAEGFYSDELMEHIVRHGTLAHADVPQWVKEIFRTSHDITPEWHVRMQAQIQAHTDNAVSKTINFDSEATTEHVAAAYLQAYRTGCKGITVYRDGSKDQQVLSTGDTGREKGSQGQENGHQSGHLIPRERPRSIQGVTERVRTGHGNMYVTINFDEAGDPFEVFANLGKAGGCDSAQIEAVSRLVSLALRSGIGLEVVLEQLRGITCCPAWDGGTLVKSSPDAIAVAVERHVSRDDPGQAEGNPAGMNPARMLIEQERAPEMDARTTAAMEIRIKDATPAHLRCPDCSQPLIFEEGCAKCPGCHWNKCE